MSGKRWIQALCWLGLAGALMCWRPLAAGLPVGNEGLAAQAYEGWAGVLRVWVSSGWQPGYGSFVPWLNQRAARFEKKHPGVYVQIESVSEGVLRSFNQAELPPDAIAFAPGMLDGGEGLCALEQPIDLRLELSRAGQWGEDLCAIPVAMGGYAWAINRAIVEQVPLDWSQLAPPEPVKKQARYLMQVPADEPYRCWSAALGALCAPRRVTAQGQIAGDAAQGLNLGLPEDIAATPTPVPETTLVTCALPSALPDSFLAGDDFYSGFTKGVYGAIPVTQREIRRLQVLSESGRAPDWTVEAGGAAFTDQLLLMAVPQTQREDSAARQALARAFLSFLLNEDSQKALTSIRALRVTQGDALYANDQGMAELEKSTSGVLRTVAAFDTGFKAQGQAEARRLVREAAGQIAE